MKTLTAFSSISFKVVDFHRNNLFISIVSLYMFIYFCSYSSEMPLNRFIQLWSLGQKVTQWSFILTGLLSSEHFTFFSLIFQFLTLRIYSLSPNLLSKTLAINIIKAWENGMTIVCHDHKKQLRIDYIENQFSLDPIMSNFYYTHNTSASGVQAFVSRKQNKRLSCKLLKLK